MDKQNYLYRYVLGITQPLNLIFAVLTKNCFPIPNFNVRCAASDGKNVAIASKFDANHRL